MRTVPPIEVSIEDMLLTVDVTLKHLPRPKLQSISTKDWIPDMESHVIVVACMQDQIAETEHAKKKGLKVWGGVFTSLLIDILRLGILDKRATYLDLLDALLKLQSQMPIMAGKHDNT